MAGAGRVSVQAHRRRARVELPHAQEQQSDRRSAPPFRLWIADGAILPPDGRAAWEGVRYCGGGLKAGADHLPDDSKRSRLRREETLRSSARKRDSNSFQSNKIYQVGWACVASIFMRLCFTRREGESESRPFLGLGVPFGIFCKRSNRGFQVERNSVGQDTK